MLADSWRDRASGSSHENCGGFRAEPVGASNQQDEAHRTEYGRFGSATGGAGAGKIKFNEFTIKKTTDRASATFFKNCCAGAHYKTVIINMRKAGGDPAASGKEFLRFKFDTVFTTKIDWSDPGDEGPEESITFVYGKLGVKFIPQEPGSQPVVAGWDQVLNQDAHTSPRANHTRNNCQIRSRHFADSVWVPASWQWRPGPSRPRVPVAHATPARHPRPAPEFLRERRCVGSLVSQPLQSCGRPCPTRAPMSQQVFQDDSRLSQ